MHVRAEDGDAALGMPTDREVAEKMRARAALVMRVVSCQHALPSVGTEIGVGLVIVDRPPRLVLQPVEQLRRRDRHRDDVVAPHLDEAQDGIGVPVFAEDDDGDETRGDVGMGADQGQGPGQSRGLERVMQEDEGQGAALEPRQRRAPRRQRTRFPEPRLHQQGVNMGGPVFVSRNEKRCGTVEHGAAVFASWDRRDEGRLDAHPVIAGVKYQ